MQRSPQVDLVVGFLRGNPRKSEKQEANHVKEHCPRAQSDGREGPSSYDCSRLYFAQVIPSMETVRKYISLPLHCLMSLTKVLELIPIFAHLL